MNKENKIFQLEKENFRVNSTGWDKFINNQGITYLQNFEKDIWEYVGGVDERLIGQQLLSWSSVMRETGKVGKRIPTDKEFNQFRKEDFGKIIYAGTRYTDTSFYNLDINTNFWSSSVSGPGSNACILTLYYDSLTVYRSASNQTHGFSVRCLKN